MTEQYPVDNLRIRKIKDVASPLTVYANLPDGSAAAKLVWSTRHAIHDILDQKDNRLVVITGPCSIHDPKAALEFASRLKALESRFSQELIIIMRTYFEKPRTTIGWKGLINDPNLDNSFEINKGLHLARKLMLEINLLGVPVGTEYLDVITPQYITDLVSWGAIGARTTESQMHRELASGLSCPVGFKNGTGGNVQVAVDAVKAARQPHHFLSLRKTGQSAIFETSGNPYCHIILRGGREPNYQHQHVEQSAALLNASALPSRIMVDFSHANSAKVPERQIAVCEDVCRQISAGDERIFGVMIESNLKAGSQAGSDSKDLIYGQSITDACIDWQTNVRLIEMLAEAVRKRG